MSMTRMFNDYDTFVLTRETDDGSVPAGTVGVVLMVLGGVPCAYEVEFPDGDGGNLGDEMTYTISEKMMRGQDVSSNS